MSQYIGAHYRSFIPLLRLVYRIPELIADAGAKVLLQAGCGQDQLLRSLPLLPALAAFSPLQLISDCT